MKILVSALVAVIVWNGLLTGVVVWQRQALLNDEFNLAVLGGKVGQDHTQLQQVTRSLNADTKYIVKQNKWDAAVEKLLGAMVKALESDSPEKPSSLIRSR